MGATCYVWIGLKSVCKVPVFLVRFEWNLNFLDRFSKNHEILNLMKILPVVAELFIADGRTGRRIDMTLIVAFHNFVNTPKNGRPIGRFGDIVPQTPVKAASFVLYCTTHYDKKKFCDGRCLGSQPLGPTMLCWRTVYRSVRPSVCLN